MTLSTSNVQAQKWLSVIKKILLAPTHEISTSLNLALIALYFTLLQQFRMLCAHLPEFTHIHVKPVSCAVRCNGTIIYMLGMQAVK